MSLPCPDCGGRSRVTDTRNLVSEKGAQFRRRYRKCTDCGTKFVSDEHYGKYRTTRKDREEPWYMAGAFDD